MEFFKHRLAAVPGGFYYEYQMAVLRFDSRLLHDVYDLVKNELDMRFAEKRITERDLRAGYPPFRR